MAFPQTGLLDNFNRADSANPGANWSIYFADSGQIQIVSNQAAGNNSSNWNGSYWTPSTFGPDSEIYVDTTVLGSNKSINLSLRATGAVATAPSGYCLFITLSTGTWQIQRLDTGGQTNLGASFSQAISAGDSVGFSAVGSTLTAYYKAAAGSWTSLTTRTDSTYSSAGNLALEIEDVSVKVDNFSGGTVVAGAATITATGLVTTDILGAGSASPTGLNLSGKGFTQPDRAGAATLSLGVSIQGNGFVATSPAGAATVSPLATISGSGLVDTPRAGAGTIAPIATLSGSGLSPVTDQVGAGSVSLGAVSIQGAGYTSPDQSGAATITAGVIGNVPGSGYAQPDQFGAGTVSAQGVTISGSGYSDSPGAGAGTVSGASITILGAGLTSPDVYGAGIITAFIPLATIPGSGFVSPDQGSAGTVSLGTITAQGKGAIDTGNAGAGIVEPVATIQGKGYSDPVARNGAGVISSTFTVIGSGLVAENVGGAAILSLPVHTIQGQGYNSPDRFGAGAAAGPVIISPYSPKVTITQVLMPEVIMTETAVPTVTISEVDVPVVITSEVPQ